MELDTLNASLSYIDLKELKKSHSPVHAPLLAFINLSFDMILLLI